MSESRHEETDPWEDYVMRFVASERDKGAKVVRAVDALSRGVAISADKQTNRELRRVQAILRRRLGSASVQWLEGRAQRVYPVAK